MDARVSRTLMLFPALLLAVALAGCGDPAAPLEAGTRFPVQAGRPAAAGAEVVWVLRAEDFLTCQNAANGVRALQRRAGGRMRVSVLYVGDAHEEWVRGFLRRQRIDARVARVDEAEFRRSFGARPAPWLYLLRDGVVRGVAPGIGRVDASSWAAAVAGGAEDG